jgi:hypothetical protein
MKLSLKINRIWNHHKKLSKLETDVEPLSHIQMKMILEILTQKVRLIFRPILKLIAASSLFLMEIAQEHKAHEKKEVLHKDFLLLKKKIKIIKFNYSVLRSQRDKNQATID